MDKKLYQDLNELFSEGPENVHIVSDFDGTLTREYIDGEKTPSLISILRKSADYLNADYQKEAYALYDQYYPIEINPDLPLDYRKEKMREWWIAHYRLLFEHGLNKRNINQILSSGYLQFRPGAKEFLELTHESNLPVVIFSASVAGEALQDFCKKEQIDFPNLHFLTNNFKWDKNGSAIDFCEPVITSLNKDETALDSIPQIREQIQNRPNVLLLGNNLGDLGMSQGGEIAQEVSIAFIDPEESPEKIATLRQKFDHVLQSDYTETNSALRDILQK